jgi:hypothetical protein
MNRSSDTAEKNVCVRKSEWVGKAPRYTSGVSRTAITERMLVQMYNVSESVLMSL